MKSSRDDKGRASTTSEEASTNEQAGTRLVEGAEDYSRGAALIRLTAREDDDETNDQDVQDYADTADTLTELGKLRSAGDGTSSSRSTPEQQQQQQVVYEAVAEEAVRAYAIPDGGVQLVGTLAQLSEEALGIHTTLRTRIKNLKTVQECADLYDSSLHYHECIRLLRQAQDTFIRANSATQNAVNAREEWAKQWATALSRDEEWAWALNHCRKTALELLYQVCNLCFQDSGTENVPWSAELEDTFKFRRIDEILCHCLVMDRYNTLYNMMIRTTGERGLGWYSKYDEGKYQKEFGAPLNPRGPAINKRLWWLFQVPTFHNDPVIERWMKIAVPPRLESR